MKITEKQLSVLIRVLEGSLTIFDRTDMNLFGYNYEIRKRTWEEIVNQQSDKIIDIKDVS
jgi:hypothetical protein